MLGSKRSHGRSVAKLTQRHLGEVAHVVVMGVDGSLDRDIVALVVVSRGLYFLKHRRLFLLAMAVRIDREGCRLTMMWRPMLLMVLLIVLLPFSITPLRSEAGYPSLTDVPVHVIADPAAVIVDLTADTRRRQRRTKTGLAMLTTRRRMVMIMETITAEGYPGAGRYFPRI
jgi:hypothetical protein